MLKMLVPYDNSAASNRALDLLISRKDRYRDTFEIHLINVQPPIAGGGRVSSMLGRDAVNDYHRDEAMAVLKPGMDKLEAAGMQYVHHITVGDAPELIAKFCKDQGCDEIVMGTRGMGTAGSLLLGSVAMKTIHFADVPVLLVK